MKRNAIIRIIFYSLTIVFLSGILFAGISWNLYSVRSAHHEASSDNVTVEPASAESIAADEIRCLEIDWAAGKIVIEPGDVPEITVQETGSGSDPMVVSRNGSELKIEYCKNASFIGINSSSEKDLHICVPQGWECEKLDVDAASAIITVCNLTIHDAEVDAASGLCDFRNCWIENLKMDSVSCDLAYTGTLNKLNMDCASSNADVHVTNQPKSICMNSMSGDLVLTLPDDCGFSVSRSTLSGSFTCDFDTEHSNGCYIHGTGDCKISVDGLSAGISIHNHTHSCSGTQALHDVHNEEKHATAAHHEDPHHG